MGLIGKLFRTGKAVQSVAEVFVPNKTKKLELDHAAFTSAHAQFAAEFAGAPRGFFDRFVNALNRLPRPVLALGTVGLFVFAMVDPVAFTERMVGLSYVPEPLWWLLGAIVSFYFGARELHHLRASNMRLPEMPKADTVPEAKAEPEVAPKAPDFVKPVLVDPAAKGANAALAEWQALKKG